MLVSGQGEGGVHDPPVTLQGDVPAADQSEVSIVILTNHSSPEHGHGLLELRGLDRAREVGQGHLLPLLASGQELLHLDYRNCRCRL